jgi:diguanylate cyclase (GGDEF)-like protein
MTATLAFAAVALTAFAAHILVGLGGHRSTTMWNGVLYMGIEIAATGICLWRARLGRDRLAWGVVGTALALTCFSGVYAQLVLAKLAHPPDPSLADFANFVCFILLYAGVMLLIRARAPRLTAVTWLEGALGALSLATVTATFVFDPVVASTHGNVAQVATNLAYPMFDVLLLAFVGAGFALLGKRAGSAFVVLGVGALVNGGADAVYLVQSAHGTFGSSSPVYVTWLLAYVIVALAAWKSVPDSAPPEEEEPGGRTATLLTGFFAVLIVAIVAVEPLRPIPVAAHVLLTLSMIVLIVRIAVAGRERSQLARTTIEARTDDLTGLANRRGLYAAADQALADGAAAALLLLDLNRFKELNDTLGHNVGDEVLCQVAVRLQQALTSDCLLARLGGDEFVVLVTDDVDQRTAEKLAQALQDALEEPLTIDEFLIPIRASIGVALAPDHAKTRAELMRCADVAMYRAKSRQTGTETYTHTTDEHSRDRLLFVSELRHALSNHELVLHYQPKVCVADRSFEGVEALARWQHPRLGLLSPAHFIETAEREGLIRLLTLEVLDLALRQQREWQDSGYSIPISLNLSPANLLDTRLPDEIADALERHECDPALLELEITETTLMRDPERALDVIARISELGVAFSLDDFGTGYSSLAQLRHLPVRTLKIDRSFIMNMTDSEDDANIVRSTIAMGRSLKLMTVAEGVETVEHLRALEEYGCNTAQGFYLSKPIPAQSIISWLDTYNTSGHTPQLAAE